jgi:hypothetical protein
MRTCVNCNKKIGIKEHYFEVIERDNHKILNVKYAHKNCQDKYDKMLMDRQVSPEMAQNLGSALKKANDLLNKMGGEEVVYIE